MKGAVTRRRATARPAGSGTLATDAPAKLRHLHWADVRGISRLVHDATVGVTDVVEAMHATILRRPAILELPHARRARGVTGFVYRSVRGVTRLVGTTLDAALKVVQRIAPDGVRTPKALAMIAALNGVVGDHLEASGNPLAMPMSLVHGSQAAGSTCAQLADVFETRPAHVVVLVHGLCLNDLKWNRRGHDHGAALARDLGCLPVYLRYNTGRHIGANGADFALLLERLWQHAPVPRPRLSILAHSMGGLVARSACERAASAGHAWLRDLDAMVFLGTPHLGAPLERVGRLVDVLLGRSPYTAPFRKIGGKRSAGIRDLALGLVCQDDREEARAAAFPVPLPPGIRCHAIAGSLQRPQAGGRSVVGDGLVPIASALGRHADPDRRLALPRGRTWIAHGMGHLDLLARVEVYETIRAWLRESPRAR